MPLSRPPAHRPRPVGEGRVSEWITWRPCPLCGSPAALGWVSVIRGDGGPAAHVPVEFDCSGGCSWDRCGSERGSSGNPDEGSARQGR
jgi:hypothetical protein